MVRNLFLDLDNGIITLDADCYAGPEEIRLELEEERHNLSKEYIEEYLKDLLIFTMIKQEQSKFALWLCWGRFKFSSYRNF